MTTHWDKIYKDYLKGGEAWATLSEGIMPEFVTLIETSMFPIKSAFDIGVGDGKYLKYLKARGFKLAGIDNSETAIKMATESLGQNEGIVLADMFDYQIPVNAYDLVLSVATIHHGYKDQIKKAISQICRGLVSGGYAFITLPIWEAKEAWKSFRTHKEVAPGVVMPTEGPEAGLAHSIYKREEVEQLFSKFSSFNIADDDRQRFIITAVK